MPIVTDTIEEEEEPEDEDDEEETHEDSTFSKTQSNETVLEAYKTPGSKPSKESNIQVGVRIRPLRSDEEKVVDTADTQVVVNGKTFNFDLVLEREASQEEVYTKMVSDRVHSVINGYNATVFAYGQTGTGKTFSMGTSQDDSTDDDQKGIILRSLEQVFEELKNGTDDESYPAIKISFLEIIRDQVYDLLSPSNAKVPLQVREVNGAGVFRVIQLTEKKVSSAKEAVDLLARGGRLRTTESTALNSNSSRSHAVFSISLVSGDRDGNTVTRKLNLVDLAGSESQNRSGAEGARFEEAKSINKGLTALNRVIKALSTQQAHVPYRDSVLTKVLRDSLDKRSYVSMLACISPGEEDVSETINTLRMSNDAKNLKIKPLPAALQESCRASVSKNKSLRRGIPSTPLNRGNNTIHDMTPSRTTPKSGVSGVKRPAFNRTIGTPGKRARTELSFARDRHQSAENPITSTVSKNNLLHESLCDLSRIDPVQEAAVAASVTNAHDMSSLLSPLMRTVRENIHEEFAKLKTDLLKSKALPKTPQIVKTPVRRAKSRATSSPNMTIMTVRDMSEESDLGLGHIEVTGLDAPDQTDKENFISGVGVSFPQPPRSVNPRVRAVMASASPDLNHPALPHYDSPPSSSRVGTLALSPAPASPTIEEMERTLGINLDSPTLMFTVNKAQPGTEAKKSRKSSRRTTMMSSELNETLREIQNVADSSRRRSIRVAAQGKFYGSPSQISLEKENSNETEENLHPLLGTEKKMNPAKQQKHNRTILDFINCGNVKQLGVSPSHNFNILVIGKGQIKILISSGSSSCWSQNCLPYPPAPRTPRRLR